MRSPFSKAKACILFLILFACQSKSDFEDRKFTPFSPSVISITLLNDPEDSVFLSSRASNLVPRTTNYSKELVATKQGIYHLELEIDRPVKGSLVVNKKHVNVMMIPFDTTYVTVTMEDGLPMVNFEGKYQEINSYFLDKEKHLGYSDHRMPFNNFVNSETTYNLLKRQIDSTTAKAISFLTSYQEKNELPKWFYELEYNEMVYGAASFKSAVASYNKKFKVFEDNLPDNYFDFMNKLEINNYEAAYSPSYIWFLNGFFNHDLPSEYDEYSGFSRSSVVNKHILKSSKKKLDGVVQDVLHKYNFSYHVRYCSDTAEIDSVAKEFDIKVYKPLLVKAGTKSRNGTEVLNLSSGDTIPEFYLTNTIDSVVSIRDFKDKVVYMNFWATWCGPCIANVPSLNQMISEFQDDDRVVFLNICLESEKERWPFTIAKHQIQGVHLLAEGNWNKKLKSYFNIKGIPQYVILREGNVLEENFANKAPLVKDRILMLL